MYHYQDKELESQHCNQSTVSLPRAVDQLDNLSLGLHFNLRWYFSVSCVTLNARHGDKYSEVLPNKWYSTFLSLHNYCKVFLKIFWRWIQILFQWLTTSCRVSLSYLLYRWIIAVLLIFSLIQSIVQNTIFFQNILEFENIYKYPIYLTNIGR